jgi:hypothetical protein
MYQRYVNINFTGRYIQAVMDAAAQTASCLTDITDVLHCRSFSTSKECECSLNEILFLREYNNILLKSCSSEHQTAESWCPGVTLYLSNYIQYSTKEITADTENSNIKLSKIRLNNCTSDNGVFGEQY